MERRPHFTVSPNSTLPENVQAYLNKPEIQYYKRSDYGIGIHRIIEKSYHNGINIYVQTKACSSSKKTGKKVDKELARWLSM